MKKIIISVLMVALFATFANALTTVLVGGGFEYDDFSEDIACKYELWTGGSLDGGNDGFPCLTEQGRIVWWVKAGILEEDNGDFVLATPIMQRLLDIGAAGTGEGYLTSLEYERLESIANRVPIKLATFFEACTPEGETLFVDAETYSLCKLLLTDLLMELGEGAKIIWFTPDALGMVQVLEEYQENINHLLNRLDEGAALGPKGGPVNPPFNPQPINPLQPFDAKVGYNLAGPIIIVDPDPNELSADVSLMTDGCALSAGNRCKQVDEWWSSADNPPLMEHVYMTLPPAWFEPVTTQIITEGPAPIYWNIFWTGDSQYNPELRYCDVLYNCWWEETPLGIQCCSGVEWGQEGTPTSSPSSNSFKPTEKGYNPTSYDPPPGLELQRHFVFECLDGGEIYVGSCCFEGSAMISMPTGSDSPENNYVSIPYNCGQPASQPTSTGPTGGVVYNPNSKMADTYPGSGPTGGMVLENSNNSTIILPILIGLIVLAGIFLLVGLRRK